jgi:hypothetical protein
MRQRGSIEDEQQDTARLMHLGIFPVVGGHGLLSGECEKEMRSS